MSEIRRARFALGQIVRHTRFGYRGVIIGVDATFAGSDEWYESVARSRPPKERPWYNILPHGAAHHTYVAERHLEPDPDGAPVEHPDLGIFFDEFREGRYLANRPLN